MVNQVTREVMGHTFILSSNHPLGALNAKADAFVRYLSPLDEKTVAAFKEATDKKDATFVGNGFLEPSENYDTNRPGYFKPYTGSTPGAASYTLSLVDESNPSAQEATGFSARASGVLATGFNLHARNPRRAHRRTHSFGSAPLDLGGSSRRGRSNSTPPRRTVAPVGATRAEAARKKTVHLSIHTLRQEGE